jgi:hypothetical protein
MFSPVFEKTLVRAGEVRSYQIQMGSNGWEVSQKDNQKVAHRHYADWHRVERTLEQFEHEIATLRSEGWLESQAVKPHFPDAGPA